VDKVRYHATGVHQMVTDNYSRMEAEKLQLVLDTPNSGKSDKPD
jgi:hypothetical protein